MRPWNLHPINVRTNHVNTVVSIRTKKPEIVLNVFKADAARCEKADAGAVRGARGRIKAANGTCEMNKAMRGRSNMSFLYGQGHELPEFDDLVRTACGSGRI